MTIRQATGADLIWIRMLFGKLLEEHPLPYPFYGPPDLEAFTVNASVRLGTDPRFLVWVAEEGDVIGGFIMGEVCERIAGTPRRFGLCSWLYVLPTWRGQGIARQLSAAILQQGAELGCESIELCALPSDDQWYRRGWIPVSVVYALPTTGVAASFASRRIPNGDAVEHDTPKES